MEPSGQSQKSCSCMRLRSLPKTSCTSSDIELTTLCGQKGLNACLTLIRGRLHQPRVFDLAAIWEPAGSRSGAVTERCTHEDSNDVVMVFMRLNSTVVDNLQLVLPSLSQVLRMRACTHHIDHDDGQGRACFHTKHYLDGTLDRRCLHVQS
jgi:hypothetical protein